MSRLTPTPQQRTALALAATVVGVTTLSVLWPTRAGHAPAPCAQPAFAAPLLRCDGNGAPARARAWLVGRKLDANTASVADFEAIPGVGPALAQAIVKTREANGGFVSLNDLDAVDGIGEKTLQKLGRWLEVDANAPTAVTK